MLNDLLMCEVQPYDISMIASKSLVRKLRSSFFLHQIKQLAPTSSPEQSCENEKRSPDKCQIGYVYCLFIVNAPVRRDLLIHSFHPLHHITRPSLLSLPPSIPPHRILFSLPSSHRVQTITDAHLTSHRIHRHEPVLPADKSS